MADHNSQLYLPGIKPISNSKKEGMEANGQINKLKSEDKRFHDWYRFVLSFPPHLVRTYIQEFELGEGHSLLDPFCGTGTTLIEAKLNNMKGVGIEANYFAKFATSVKLDWDIDVVELRSISRNINEKVKSILLNEGISDSISLDVPADNFPLKTLSQASEKLLIKNSISQLPLHKTLHLLNEIDQYKHTPCHGHFRLALAKALVFSISNLRFGPEVGVGKIKHDTPVVDPWMTEVRKIADDIETIQDFSYPTERVILGDARNLNGEIPNASIDAVITSPPYPNEKDYSRTTRLESVLLGFISDKMELRGLKKTFVRSNSRGVYKDDNEREYIKDNEDVQMIVKEIENKRKELGKTSGFEKLYARVTEEYFGGITRHLQEIKPILRPGAKLAYVVGDQASYLRVMIRTGQLFSKIALNLGYKIERIDLFRTRFATASKEQLREEVVILTWPGG